MTLKARFTALFASFGSSAALHGLFVAVALAGFATPGVSDARAAGGYDGIWNVLIITEAGSCDPAYSYPFKVTGGRISSAGAADISGSVGGGGGVSVRISAGGSVASGTGKLGGSSGSGRWNAKVSSGNCSGRWQATRS